MEDHTARGSGLAHIHYIVILKRKEAELPAGLMMHRLLSRDVYKRG